MALQQGSVHSCKECQLNHEVKGYWGFLSHKTLVSEFMHILVMAPYLIVSSTPLASFPGLHPALVEPGNVVYMYHDLNRWDRFRVRLGSVLASLARSVHGIISGNVSETPWRRNGSMYTTYHARTKLPLQF